MSDMDAVNQFYAELQSLYDVKPPISKGKMTSITRAALKAVRLYKHVVQSVEKFIQKCKTEYKIPGLYVIDSIIRQSRHQFGPEKDVFAPRFSRNIQTTFVHLYRCPEEDKAKVIRVLNLWQKNRIFSPEVIQPLFDLADPQNPIWEQINTQSSNSESGMNNLNNSTGGNGGVSSSNAIVNNFPSLANVHFNKKLLDFDYGDGDEDGIGNMSGGKNSSDPANSSNNSGPLDALGSILSNPEILRQLQTLQELMGPAAAAAVAHSSSSFANTPEQERQRKLAELSKQEAAFDQRLAETVARLPFAKDCELPLPPDDSHCDPSGVDQNSNQLSGSSGSNVLLPPPFFHQLSEQQQQNQQNSQHQQQLLQNLFRNAAAVSQQTSQQNQNPFGLPVPFPIQGVPPPFPSQDSGSSSVPLYGQSTDSGFFNHFNNQPPQITISQKIYEEIDLCDDSKDDGELPGSHSTRDRDRSSRSKRSRSPHDRHESGRGRSSRRSRSRSRDRGRSKRSYRSRSRERGREEREKEKERQRKGLPPLKKEHLSVCSTTLWVGHLSKLVSQEEISDTFGSYGDVVSIDLIPPRGCAFIVMNRRQDAVRALERLKNTKLQGKAITLAWAPGKGVKGREWKDYWGVEGGVSYIPWSKMKEDTNLEEFEDGGCIDEDTVPDFLKNKPAPPSDKLVDHQMILLPPLPLDNENSEDSNSMIQPPLPPPTSLGGPPPGATAGQIGLPGMGAHHSGGIPSLLDPAALAAAVSGKAGDTDGRADGPHPPMPPGPFGMGPPGLGMIPMGMNLMVPPPAMLGMGPNPFQGMGNLPGMPPMMGMGMVPAPTLPVPPGGGPPPLPGLGGAPGLLGEMPGGHAGVPPPQTQQLNDSLLNNSNEESAVSSSELVNHEDGGSCRRGKKRSRFDDPEEKLPPSGENSVELGSLSPSQMKDERPVFERLKSLAEGYSFASDKSAGSLLGTPPGPGGPRPIIPNSFGQPTGILGTRPVRPPPLFEAAPHHQPPPAWSGFGDNTENPFLNPSPNNPFAAAASAGNPFVPGNFGSSENPFEMASSNSQGNPFAALNERGGFGGRRGGWSRDGEWGGRGRGGRGSRGGWRGGRGGWANEQHMEELMENDLEVRGGFRGGRGGRGGRDNPWASRVGDNEYEYDRRSSERERDRPRSREGERGNSRGRRSRSPSQRRDRDESDRGGRRRRNSPSNENSDRRSRHRSGEDNSGRRRGSERSSSSWQKRTDHDQDSDQAPKQEESWEMEDFRGQHQDTSNQALEEQNNDNPGLNNEMWEGEEWDGNENNNTDRNNDENIRECEAAPASVSRERRNSWMEEDNCRPPGDDSHQEEEQDTNDNENNLHQQQYEQDEYPVQEEMGGQEEDYPPQEESNHLEEEAQYEQEEIENKTDEGGYTNNDEEYYGNDNGHIGDADGGDDYSQEGGCGYNNDNNGDNEEYTAEKEREVYDNGDESYENESNRNDEYSHYNNDNEAEEDENCEGNRDNGRDVEGVYQDDNECSNEEPVVSSTYDNNQEDNVDDGGGSGGKCTSFVNNSATNNAVEEMSSIPS